MAERDLGISVVIPVLHDDGALNSLLVRLRREPTPPREIVVVDGAERSDCEAICARFGARRVAARPARGAQLNAGANAAAGAVLWFVHADATPPPGCLKTIERAMVSGVVGGYFRFRFDGPVTWYKSTLQTLINLRTKIGVPYGDQGLFAACDAFFAAGGFSDAPLFEEVPLVRALRRAGAMVELKASIGVSCRRWERDGWLRRSLANRALAAGYTMGIAPEALARRYRGGPGEDRENAAC